MKGGLFNPFFTGDYSWWGGSGARVQFGEILNDSFARASVGSNYTAAGTATWGANGTDLTTSGGHTTYADRLEYNYPQTFEKWDLEVQFVVTSAIDGSSYGIGIGHEDTQKNWNWLGALDTSNDANTGKVRILTTNASDTAVIRATSATTVTVVQNETYTLLLSRNIVSNVANYTVTCTRVSNGTSNTTTVSENPAVAAAPLANATGKWAIWSFGGSVTIKYLKATVYDYKNIDYLLVSQSIGHGLCATNAVTRYIANLNTTNYSVSAGSSDEVLSVIGKAQNLLDYSAGTYIIALGTNDVAAGVAVGTIMTRLQSVINPLIAAGKRVVILYEIPRNGFAIATLNTNLDSTFPTLTRIDIYTPLNSGGNLNATYNSGDNIHPNQAGHTLMATTIKTALGL